MSNESPPITPACRYGHGPLRPAHGGQERRYVLRSVFKSKNAEGDDEITETPYVFTLHLFRCDTCGYLEMFDDEL